MKCMASFEGEYLTLIGASTFQVKAVSTEEGLLRWVSTMFFNTETSLARVALFLSEASLASLAVDSNKKFSQKNRTVTIVLIDVDS